MIANNSTNIEQGSDAWRESRRGKATASRISDIMAKTKSGPSASRTNYMAELVAERLTGKVADGFDTPAMRWGRECEPLARAAYEAYSDNLVEQVAMIDHPTIAMAGASPDGLIGDDGLVEIKCPNTATHISTILTGVVDKKYIMQMMWQMACTGRQWCDFVSFDPRLNPELQLYVKRFDRHADQVREISQEVEVFLAEVDDTVKKLNLWSQRNG